MIRTLSQELTERGLVFQHSAEKVEDILEGKQHTFYLGADPTADSLTVGNLVAYVLARHLRNHGHKVILLIGGGTGLIGDPSGKNEERQLSSAEDVQARAAKLAKQVEHLLDDDELKVVDNYTWLSGVSFLEFLRDVGKHFTVNTMMKRESVARRIDSETGISFTEFTYSLLQAYDFYHLFKEENCTLQIGGSDQWGNMVAGIELIRKKLGKEAHVLTLPLIVDKKSGKKFGKSEGNAVWLDSEMTSPYAFYQFWLHTDDDATIDLLKKYTFLELEKIAELKEALEQAPEKREAQQALAWEVTRFVHGEEQAEAAKKVSDILFGGASLEGISASEQELLLREAPSYAVSAAVSILDLLTETGLAQSRREAKDFVKSGAVTINGEKIEDMGAEISSAEYSDQLVMLRRGKKNKCVLSFE